MFYLPQMTEWLLFMGQILCGNLYIYDDKNTLTFSHIDTMDIVLVANTNKIYENIYWVDTQIVTNNALFALGSIHENSYEMWHWCLRHLSDQILEKFKTKTRNFPSDLKISKESPICEGCAKGKMCSCSFPKNENHASKPFEWIHSNLWEYPTLSYSKYKYYIFFLDDYTSYACIILLQAKTGALAATK